MIEIMERIMVCCVVGLALFILYVLWQFAWVESVECKNGIEYYKTFYRLSVKLDKDGKPIKCETGK